MRLALVPIIQHTDPVRGTWRGPALPEPVEWHQASSLWDSPAGGFQQLILADITDAQALAWARAGIVVLDEAVDLSALRAQMHKPHARAADFSSLRSDARAARGTSRMADATRRMWDLHRTIADSGETDRREYLATYRDAAARFEREWFRVPPGVVALTTLHQDSFNRADTSDIGGSTMSDGVGAWSSALYSGLFKIASNVIQQTGGNGTYCAYYDSAMSDVDVQRASLTISTWTQSGPFVRIKTSDGSGYTSISFFDASLYRVDAGTRTSLGTGSSPTGGDIISCDASGSSISHLVNGSTRVGPVTDTTYSTGRCGVFSDGAAGGPTEDDFLAEVASATSAIKTINGLARASIKTINGLAIASVKTFNGLA